MVAMGEEVWTAGANEIVGWWGVDYFLHVCTVEVVVWSSSKTGESEVVPEIWTEVCQMIDVEARVDVVDGVVNIIVNITAIHFVAWSWWELSCGRKLCSVGIVEVYETAGLGASFDSCHVCLVEANDILIVLERRKNRSCV